MTSTPFPLTQVISVPFSLFRLVLLFWVHITVAFVCHSACLSLSSSLPSPPFFEGYTSPLPYIVFLSVINTKTKRKLGRKGLIWLRFLVHTIIEELKQALCMEGKDSTAYSFALSLCGKVTF